MCLPLAVFHPGCLWSRARCFLGFSQGRDDFQGRKRLRVRALRWEGPLCPPRAPPAVPAAAPEVSLPQHWLPGSQTHPPHAEQELGIFHINVSLGFLLFFFSHCMEKSVSPSGAGGRGFSQHGQTLHCSLWRGLMGCCQIPASPDRAWLGSGGLCSAGGASSTSLGTGHCGMGLLDSPRPQNPPAFVCSVLR